MSVRDMHAALSSCGALPLPACGAVTPYHIRGSQDDMVGFRVKIPILGDITLGLWFGDHRTEHDPPAFAYAANTAFLQVWSCMRSGCGIAAWTEPCRQSGNPVLIAIAPGFVQHCAAACTAPKVDHRMSGLMLCQALTIMPILSK